MGTGAVTSKSPAPTKKRHVARVTCSLCQLSVGATGLYRHQHGPWCYTRRIKILARAHDLEEIDKDWAFPMGDAPEYTYLNIRRLLIKHEALIRLPTGWSGGFRGRSARLYLIPWCPSPVVAFLVQFLLLRAAPIESAHQKAEVARAELTFENDLAVRVKRYKRSHPDFAALRILFQ